MISKGKSTLPASARPKSASDMQQVSDETWKSEIEEAKAIEASDFRVHPGNPEADQRSKRLREAIQAAGGNKAVSAKSGVPSSTLHAYLTGQDWKFSAAIALALACNVSLSWLATGEEPTQIHSASNLARIPNGDGQVAPSKAETSSNLVLIPRYDVHPSAGPGTLVDQEEVLGMMAFDEMFIRRKLGVRAEALATVEATGDSMEPTIHDGDLLLIDTSENEIRDGRIYVLNVHGFVTVKRIRVNMDGSLAICSDNTRYDTQIIIPSERDPLRVVGRVVYQAGPVRA